MRFIAIVLAAALLGACAANPSPEGTGTTGIREVVDQDGLTIRIEEEGEEEGDLDDAAIAARMDAFRAAKAAAPGRMRAFMRDGGFDPFEARNCPPEGSATTQEQARRNRLKNRIDEPSPGDIDPKVTLRALRRKGDDRERWSESRAATIVGYVRKASGTGKESCNCKVSTTRLTDTHIDIVSKARDTKRPVVVEITPLWRLIHEHEGLEDWSSIAIRDKYEGHRVRITGWLFFDEAHVTGADTTDPSNTKGEKNWRATAWEIHPVTSIEIID